MTAERTLALLYHSAQESDALRMAEDLKLAPLRCQTLEANSTENWQKADAAEHILVLVSDNLLHDQACMNAASSYLPQWQSKGKLIFLLTPGTRTAENGQTERYPTQIERTKDFMRYINFWQQQYLELRRRKRQASPEELPLIQEKIQNLRTISADIGNFFNFLRSLDNYSPEEIQQNDYQKLFELLSLTEAWPAFAKHRQSHDSEAPLAPEGISSPPAIDEEPAPEEAPALKQTPAEKAPEEETETTPQGPEPDEPMPEQAKPDQEESTPETTDTEEESPQKEEPKTKEKEESYTVEQLLQKARELRERDEQEKALQMLEKGIEQYPNEAELRYRYALLLIEHRKEAETASHQLSQAIQLAPKRVEIRFLLAELLEYLDEQIRAIEHYEIITRQAPQQAEAWSRLAILYATFMPEKKKKAGKAYAKAAKYNPEDADLQFLYAQHLREKGAKRKKIIKALKEVLHRNTGHATAHLELARLYLAKNKIEKAQAHYLRARQLRPELSNAENNALFLTAATTEKKAGSGQDQPTENDTKKKKKKKKYKKTPHKKESKKQQPKGEAPRKPIALITGASSGIGMKTAHRFAREGYRLILCARRKERLQKLQAELQEKYQTEAISLPFDIRSYEACQKAWQSLDENWQQVDVLVNNAGLALGFDPIHQGSIEDWDTMIDTNLKGLLYITRLVSPGMVARKRGHIINIGSTAGKEVYPNGNVYCATKFAVDALTKAMRIDLYKHGIKVGQVCPGHVKTEFAKVRFHHDEEKADIYQGFTPLRPEDVAELIYCLTSQPEHVNIQDVLLMSKNQAGSNFVDRKG